MRLLPVAAVALLLAGCRGMPPAPVDPAIKTMLLRYDANKDFIVSRAEMETGLTAEFAAADANRDGKLDDTEINAVNDARWRSDASRTSPLQDWNQDGSVDAREFGTEIRSLFEAIDGDHDGRLSPEELAPPGSEPRPNGPGRGPGGVQRPPQ